LICRANRRRTPAISADVVMIYHTCGNDKRPVLPFMRGIADALWTFC
jgi:hypothetical protein